METRVLTSQYVRIEQPTASVGDRMLAQLVDWIIMAAYFTFAGWVALKTNAGFNVSMVCVVLPVMLYTLLMEVFNRGQSIGKMLLRLRVVKLDGTPPTLGSYLLRWLLWIVDGPTFSFLGLIVMIINRSNQRLGDLAAGTVVIKLQDYKRIQVSLDDYDYLANGYTPRYPHAADLSLEQIEVIRRTLEMKQPERTQLLVQKVCQKLGIANVYESTDEQFLQRIVRDYQYYALEEV